MKEKKKERLLLINQSGKGGLRKHLCDLISNLDYETLDVWIVYNDKEVDDLFRQTIMKLSGKLTPVLIDSFVRELDIKNDFKTYFMISKLIKEIKPDIVHCHSSKAGVLGRLAARRRKVKKIFYTPHWYSFLSPEFSPLKRKIFIVIEKYLSIHATTKTFNTSYGERESALSYNVDIKNKFEVIYNGLPKIKFPNKIDIRKELNLPQDVFLFGNTARLSHQKNPILFIEVANEVIKNNKNIHFVWIGDGPLMEEVKLKVDSLDTSDNLHLIGSKENSEFLVHGFDAFLSTSNGESFGYSAVEALRAGVPVLLSNVMGHNEICVPYENGLLFSNERTSDITSKVFDFINWKKTSDTEKIVNSFQQRFSIDQMIEKIISNYNNR